MHPFLSRRFSRGEASRYFVTFADSHDRAGRTPGGRFLYRDPFREQATLAIGRLLTSPGIPCICYRAEQGFRGGVIPKGVHFGGAWGPDKSRKVPQ